MSNEIEYVKMSHEEMVELLEDELSLAYDTLELCKDLPLHERVLLGMKANDMKARLENLTSKGCN